MIEFAATSPAEQEALGEQLAEACPAAFVIFLHGDLGAGKTTLVRGFLRGLGYAGAVKSPTYTLMEPYILEQRRCFHFDLYRLADPEELEYLGLRDLLQEESILLFEWPDRGQGELPEPDLIVSIEFDPAGRRLQFLAETESGRRVVDALRKSA